MAEKHPLDYCSFGLIWIDKTDGKFVQEGHIWRAHTRGISWLGSKGEKEKDHRERHRRVPRVDSRSRKIIRHEPRDVGGWLKGFRGRGRVISGQGEEVTRSFKIREDRWIATWSDYLFRQKLQTFCMHKRMNRVLNEQANDLTRPQPTFAS